MAYTSGFTAVTSATFTAAQYNTNVRDNFTAIWVGTTAGDIDYYTSSTTKARIAIGGSGAILRVASGIPAWLALGSAGESLVVNSTTDSPEWRKPVGIIDVSGMVERTSAVAMTSTAWTDVADLTLDLTLTRACTLEGIMTGTLAGDGTQNAKVRLSIDGTPQTDDTSSNSTISGAQVPLALSWRRTAIAAGSRNVKVQLMSGTGNNAYIQGILRARAIVE